MIVGPADLCMSTDVAPSDRSVPAVSCVWLRNCVVARLRRTDDIELGTWNGGARENSAPIYPTSGGRLVSQASALALMLTPFSAVDRAETCTVGGA
jgi:hypothetical protein